MRLTSLLFALLLAAGTAFSTLYPSTTSITFTSVTLNQTSAPIQFSVNLQGNVYVHCVGTAGVEFKRSTWNERWLQDTTYRFVNFPTSISVRITPTAATLDANGIFRGTLTMVQGDLGGGGSATISLQSAGALPIQLSSFSGTPCQDGVELTWETLSELENYGFYVQRNERDITFLPGYGTSADRHFYRYKDTVEAGSYEYRLRQVDLSGAQHFTEKISVTFGTAGMEWIEPRRFELTQNYPNPFNPKTVIGYQVPGGNNVKLSVYDMFGREVAVLVNERKAAGDYEVAFDGSALASGTYFYRLVAGSFVETKRLLLLK